MIATYQLSKAETSYKFLGNPTTEIIATVNSLYLYGILHFCKAPHYSISFHILEILGRAAGAMHIWHIGYRKLREAILSKTAQLSSGTYLDRVQSIGSSDHHSVYIYAYVSLLRARQWSYRCDQKRIIPIQMHLTI